MKGEKVDRFERDGPELVGEAMDERMRWMKMLLASSREGGVASCIIDDSLTTVAALSDDWVKGRGVY